MKIAENSTLTERNRATFPILFAVLVGTIPIHSEVRLPALISDRAMFQAEKPVEIWGWADPAAEVKVEFVSSNASPSESFTATADANGKWDGQLPPLKSGTAGQLKIITDKGDHKIVKDILVGEVWLGGGQSNMEYDLAGTRRTDTTNPKEVAEVARNVLIAQKEADTLSPPIRYFKVVARRADAPVEDVKGNWVLGDSKNVSHFSAEAWNFGVALQNKLHVPVGLIVSCVGNTPVETWMSRQTLERTSVGASVYERSKLELAGATPEKIAKYQADLNAWNAVNPTLPLQSQNKSNRPLAPLNMSASNYVPNHYYNGMISGLEPYSIRGVIWDQGASNMAHPLEYSELFQALIQEWREDWKDPHLPFYFVQVNNFQEKQIEPVQSNPFSILREQQQEALGQADVGMICSIDLGNGNPHYPNKRAVGDRLVRLALHDTYNQRGQVNSPRYKSFSVEGNKIRLKFTDSDGLRVRDKGDLNGFAIRGDTGDWVWASGRIYGHDIVVWSNQVRAPTAVRYAWAVNPITSVENGVGLPLCPFRTDTSSRD